MKRPKVDPEIRAILDMMDAQGGPPLESMSIADARGMSQGMRALGGEPEPLAAVEDLKVPGNTPLAVRVYTPEGAGPFPGVVYFHGGGYVIGDLDSHDLICRAISRRARAVVVAVDYRRAPEDKFPAAFDDCLSATEWVAANANRLKIDAHRIAVAGDSAGGTLATGVASSCRDRGGPALALQVLVYPVANMRDMDTASHKEFAEDHFLTSSAMTWFRDEYITRPEDAADPRISPIFAADLRGLPPALVITAECDPLRDEGEAYAKRLSDAGVPVTQTRYAGMIHPFFSMIGVSAKAREALDQVAGAIKSMRPVQAATA